MWRNNNLSIVLTILFAVSFVGHALSGWMAHNAEERLHGGDAIPLATFLTSSEFGETTFENWESEFLQMAFYVVLTVFLYQKGSAESKKHDGSDTVEEDPVAHRGDPDVPRAVPRRRMAPDRLQEFAEPGLHGAVPGVVPGPCRRRRTQARGGAAPARIHREGHAGDVSRDPSVLVQNRSRIGKANSSPCSRSWCCRFDFVSGAPPSRSRCTHLIQRPAADNPARPTSGRRFVFRNAVTRPRSAPPPAAPSRHRPCS